MRWLQLLRLIGAKAARETGHKVVLIDRVGGASASLGCRGSERTFDRVCVCVCVCVAIKKGATVAIPFFLIFLVVCGDAKVTS